MLQYLTKLRRKRGFTLVELIIVLVILAILAAIAIPALTGYIDKANEKKYMLMAKNIMKAAQIEFDELYADGVSLVPTSGNTITGIPGSSINEKPNENGGKYYNNDVYLGSTDFAEEIFKTAGVEKADEPYALMVGLGNSGYYTGDEAYRAYKVYFVLYWQDKNDPDSAIYFNGSEWTSEYPWKDKNAHPNNKFEIAGESEPIYIQLYMLKFGSYGSVGYSKMSSAWNEMNNTLGKK